MKVRHALVFLPCFLVALAAQRPVLAEDDATTQFRLRNALRVLPQILWDHGGSVAFDVDALHTGIDVRRRGLAMVELEQFCRFKPGTMQGVLPGFAKTVSADPTAKHMALASAFYILNKYANAETEALIAAKNPAYSDESWRAMAFAAEAALAARRYDDAAKHFQAALNLWNQEDDAKHERTPKRVDEYTAIRERALLLTAIVSALDAGGHYREAERAAQAVWDSMKGVFNKDDIFLHESEGLLGAMQIHAGHPEAAETSLRHVLEFRESHRKSANNYFPLTARCALGYALALQSKTKAAEAIKLLSEVLEAQKQTLPKDYSVTLVTRMTLGVAYHMAGRDSDAEGQFNYCAARYKTLRGAEHPETLNCRRWLAVAKAGQGGAKAVDSKFELQEIAKPLKRALGESHPLALEARVALVDSWNHQEVDRSLEAAKEARTAIPLIEKAMGAEHPLAQQARLGLIKALMPSFKTGIPPSAAKELEQQLRALVELRDKVYGPTSAPSVEARGLLVRGLIFTGKGKDAEAELAAQAKAKIETTADAVLARIELARNLVYTYRHEEAEKAFREVLPDAERLLGPNSWGTAESHCGLAEALMTQGKYEEAVKEFRIALDGEIKRPKDGRPSNEPLFQRELAKALEARGDYAEAEQVFRSAAEKQEKATGLNDAYTQEDWFFVGRTLLEQNKTEAALEVFRSTLEIQAEGWRKDSADALRTRFWLAKTLAVQEQYEAAEKEFNAVLERQQSQETALASGITTAIRNDPYPHSKDSLKELAELHRKMGKPEESAMKDEPEGSGGQM